MRSIFVACLFAMATGCATAAGDPCPAGDEWALTCFATHDGVRQIKSEYRHRLVMQKSGIAVIGIAEPHELVAVDRNGVVVIPGIVKAGDYDYPFAEQGIGRFRSTGKCGFFNGAFIALVPAQYDQCQAFHQGEAIACKDCVRYCTEDECQDSILVGGRGFAFDAKGKLLRQFALPKLEAVCGRTGVAIVRHVTGKTPRLQCKPDPNSPFKM